MNEIATQIGISIAGGVTLMALGWIIAKISQITKHTAELYDVHLGPHAVDENLTPKWYLNSLKDNLDHLAQSIEANTKTNEAIVESTEAQTKVLNDMHRDLKENSNIIKQVYSKIS